MLPENTLKWTDEVKDEIVAFIKEKTGAKSLILGVSTDESPCAAARSGMPCNGHWFETMSYGVAPESFNSYTYGMYTDLAGTPIGADLRREASGYESTTIHEDTKEDEHRHGPEGQDLAPGK